MMAKTMACKIPVLSKGKHVMTSDYGIRTLTVKGKTTTKLHKGVDFVGAGHTLDYIIAFADGVVKAAQFQSSMGYYVRIDHGNGIFTRYMHMKKGSIAVKAGQNVKKGQILGYMGATGDVTGAHLHFDICINNEYIDPKPYLKGEKNLFEKEGNATASNKTNAATQKPSTATTSKKAKDAAKSFLKSLAGTYKVTASSLNVRNGAGITKAKMVTIPKGTAVKCYGYYTSVLGVKWLYIQFTYKNVTYTGFASSAYLKK